MDNEKKKKYLNQYRGSVRAQKAIIEEITQLRVDAMFSSLNMDGMPKGSGQSDLSSYIAKRDELIKKLEDEMKRKIDLQREITERINRLESDTEAVVLRLRYIHCLKWEEIALKIGYEYRNVLYIHGRALRGLEIPEDFA